MLTPIPFRFDVERHLYTRADTGAVLPHITGMLKSAGKIDDSWFTEDSCVRGQAVHTLTAEYDLDALDVASCVSRYRGYLLAHVAAVGIEQPEMLDVELPRVHPVYQYAGRPDRALKMQRRLGVLEVKSGGADDSHELQTALQAILVAPFYNLPPEAFGRWALYLKPNGRFKLLEHKNRHDYIEARKVIKATT